MSEMSFPQFVKGRFDVHFIHRVHFHSFTNSLNQCNGQFSSKVFPKFVKTFYDNGSILIIYLMEDGIVGSKSKAFYVYRDVCRLNLQY